MKAIDFFCGAGGLTRGLLDAGINVVAGIDKEESCRKNYELNNAPAEFFCSDIRNIDKKYLLKINPQILDDPDDLLFAGCAPCQPFSQQRKTKGKRLDATILGELARLVEQLHPGQVLMENVPGITKVKGNSTFRRFLKVLDRNGYSYSYTIIDAKKYGVPQNRRRLVLIAMRQVNASLPPETHGKGLSPYVTVCDAIKRFPILRAGSEHSTIPNHCAAEISELNMERLKHTPKNGGDRTSWPDHLVLDCHKKDYKGHTDVYGRMYWNRPSPALTGKCNSISNGRYGHPTQRRAISLREAAAIQTFPDDYIFYGSKISIALQIGNAVPALLGRVLGEHIVQLRHS